jgi:hypothetical protein
MRQRQPRKKDPRFLAWLRTMPCLLCGDNVSVEACHVRKGDLARDKRQTGAGEKPDDRWALPMCGTHHRYSHHMGEPAFWTLVGVDPLEVCQVLFDLFKTLDRVAAERYLSKHKHAFYDERRTVEYSS